MADSLSNLRRPVVLAAFEGWNDAADAATDVVHHLGTIYDADVVFDLDGEDYYDYLMQRPHVVEHEGVRSIEWPSTSIAVASLPERDLVLISGPEPNMRWRSFTQSLVSALRSVRPELVIVLGAMLTDSPHSRPLPVMGSAQDAELSVRLGLEPSEYTGPTGIVGVFADACERAGMPVAMLWASVPHYVSNPPNPKATLALLTRVEDLLEGPLDLGELPDLATAWERGVNELADDDPDVAAYVSKLEERQDESELPAATGESIAAEFERYLRRRRRD